MKKLVFLHLLILCPLLTYAQVGIGTSAPNSKSILELNSTTQGLLIPRMTGAQRTSMDLSATDAGMMVFQTDVITNSPKGLYSYDGSNWCVPVGNGNLNGQTLRWDGYKWAYSTYLFNSGSSLGLGTTSPNVQLQVHSNALPSTRLQLTNGNGNNLEHDGLILGITNSTLDAHLIQQENKPLWFATNNTERMRIDSLGNIGIHTAEPEATLDVNGTLKIGEYGTAISNLIRVSVMLDLEISANSSQTIDIPVLNTLQTASVMISPGDAMADIMIAYARVSAPGNVQVKFMNMASEINNPGEMMFYITVIQ